MCWSFGTRFNWILIFTVPNNNNDMKLIRKYT